MPWLSWNLRRSSNIGSTVGWILCTEHRNDISVFSYVGVGGNRYCTCEILFANPFVNIRPMQQSKWGFIKSDTYATGIVFLFSIDSSEEMWLEKKLSCWILSVNQENVLTFLICLDFFVPYQDISVFTHLGEILIANRKT